MTNQHVGKLWEEKNAGDYGSSLSNGSQNHEAVRDKDGRGVLKNGRHLEMSLIWRDKPAVPAIMGQLSPRERSPRTGAMMSGSRTSKRIRPESIAEHRSPKVAVTGAIKSLITAGPRVLMSGFQCWTTASMPTTG